MYEKKVSIGSIKNAEKMYKMQKIGLELNFFEKEKFVIE